MDWLKLHAATIGKPSSTFWQVSSRARDALLQGWCHAALEETAGAIWFVKTDSAGRRRVMWAEALSEQETSMILPVDNPVDNSDGWWLSESGVPVFGAQCALKRGTAINRFGVSCPPFRVIEELTVSRLLVHAIDENGPLCARNWGTHQHSLEAAIARRRWDRDRKRTMRVQSDIPSDIPSDTPTLVQEPRARARGEELRVKEIDRFDPLSTSVAPVQLGGRPPVTTGDKTVRQIGTWPSDQQPDENGIRPYVHDAITSYKRTGNPAFLTMAKDEETITPTELAKLENAEHIETT